LDNERISLEVFSPYIGTWIEQRNDFAGFWIDGGKITSLIPIALRTSVGEIVSAVSAAMFSWQDMVDLVCKV